MGRTCTVCRHKDREAIDGLLVSGTGSYRRVAAQYGLSATALRRHREHLPVAMKQAQEAKAVSRADDLLGQVTSLRDRALRLLDATEQVRDYRAASGLLREARSAVELLCKIAVAMPGSSPATPEPPRDEDNLPWPAYAAPPELRPLLDRFRAAMRVARVAYGEALDAWQAYLKNGTLPVVEEVLLLPGTD